MGTFTEDKSRIPDGAIWAYWYNLPVHPDGKEEAKEALRKITLQGFDTNGFHPLGIEYHAPSSRLFVVSHHYDGSRIEIFKLDVGNKLGYHSKNPPNLVAEHLRTVINITMPAPNAIAAINEHEIYVTNDHLFPRRFHPWLNAMETFLGFGGSIVHVNLETDEVQKVASLSFANGIVLLNDTKLVASSTSTATVRLYDVNEQDHRRPLKKTQNIPIPFFPDNLSIDAENWLYIAGHPSMKALRQAVRNRHGCTGAEGTQCYKSMAPTWVSRWRELEGLQDVYVTSNGFGSGCAVARDSKHKIGLLSGLGPLEQRPAGSLIFPRDKTTKGTRAEKSNNLQLPFEYDNTA
ncbi:hypothetical protein KEM54_000620 [Ascosphaera aggregata]|nr:hypothetical protein KEM54_000620 [Ascosphaera aggregata]